MKLIKFFSFLLLFGSIQNNYPAHRIKTIFKHLFSSEQPALQQDSILNWQQTSNKKGLKIELPKNHISSLTKEKKQKFLSSKTFDEILDDCQKKTEEYFEAQEFLNLDSSKLAKAKEENPIFFLGECASNLCYLTRFGTNVRSHFSQNVAHYVKDKFADKKKLTYTSFASSGLFNDIEILNKIFELKTDIQEIDINFIDLKYKDIINFMKSREFIELTKNFTDKWNKNDRKHNELMHKQFFVHRFIQFLEWFGVETNIKINVNIYGNIYDYLDECMRNADKKSDIIVGIDFIERIYDPLIDFIKLSYLGLSHNGFAFSINTEIMFRKISSMRINKIKELTPDIEKLILSQQPNSLTKHEKSAHDHIIDQLALLEFLSTITSETITKKFNDLDVNKIEKNKQENTLTLKELDNMIIELLK